MKPYAEMSKEELVALRRDLKAKYHDFQTKDLKLDMSRGKPSVEQLDLSMGMMDVLSSDDDLTCEDGTDCRNYGVLCHHYHLRKFQLERDVRYRFPRYDTWHYGK